MEQSDFEEGKRLVIEGLRHFRSLYTPYFSLAKGLVKLGMGTFLGIPVAEMADNYSQKTELSFDTLLGDLERAKSVEEIKAAFDDQEKLISLLWDVSTQGEE